jgi:uncharacterized cupin superfamily protein
MVEKNPIIAATVPGRSKKTNYPATFAGRVEGREKRPLGDAFGISNFGVNLTTLAPGAWSALHHVHTRQDEFIYVLSGELVLVVDEQEFRVTAGHCCGFPAGGAAHHLENRGSAPATYLEIGDRTPGDGARYPSDDLTATAVEGGWVFTHKDGRPY